MSARPNVSDDLLWETVRSNNAYLVKRKTAGGVQFSRDPFNLLNKHSRTQAGLVNSKAVSVQPNGDKGVVLETKKVGKSNTPQKGVNKHAYKNTTSSRNIYKNIADSVGKHSYRSDLNKDAVARASAILDSQRNKPETPARKPRGAAGRKAQS